MTQQPIIATIYTGTVGSDRPNVAKYALWVPANGGPLQLTEAPIKNL